VSQTIHTGKISKSAPASESSKLAGKLGALVGIREAYIDKMLRASIHSACEKERGVTGTRGGFVGGEAERY